MIEKYLFLDFDGVLNTSRHTKELRKEGIDPFDEYGAMFCIPELNVKALEINAWLQQYASNSFNYVIKDDENVFFQNQQNHLVLTDEHDGLTIQKAKLAIDILNS